MFSFDCLSLNIPLKGCQITCSHSLLKKSQENKLCRIACSFSLWITTNSRPIWLRVNFPILGKYCQEKDKSCRIALDVRIKMVATLLSFPKSPIRFGKFRWWMYYSPIPRGRPAAHEISEHLNICWQ